MGNTLPFLSSSAFEVQKQMNSKNIPKTFQIKDNISWKNIQIFSYLHPLRTVLQLNLEI